MQSWASQIPSNLKTTMVWDQVHLLLLVPASSCGPAQVRDATAPFLTGPSQRTFTEPCSPLGSHREMQWAGVEGGWWVVFNTCMQMHSGYVRLELDQSIAPDGPRAPRCQAGTFQLLPLMAISVSPSELDPAVFVAVTSTAWVSLDPSATHTAFWTAHRPGQASIGSSVTDQDRQSLAIN